MNSMNTIEHPSSCNARAQDSTNPTPSRDPFSRPTDRVSCLGSCWGFAPNWICHVVIKLRQICQSPGRLVQLRGHGPRYPQHWRWHRQPGAAPRWRLGLSPPPNAMAFGLGCRVSGVQTWQATRRDTMRRRICFAWSGNALGNSYRKSSSGSKCA